MVTNIKVLYVFNLAVCCSAVRRKRKNTQVNLKRRNGLRRPEFRRSKSYRVSGDTDHFWSEFKLLLSNLYEPADLFHQITWSAGTSWSAPAWKRSCRSSPRSLPWVGGQTLRPWTRDCWSSLTQRTCPRLPCCWLQLCKRVRFLTSPVLKQIPTHNIAGLLFVYWQCRTRKKDFPLNLPKVLISNQL